MTVALADLVAGITQEQALANELAIGTTIGLPVTSWQVVGIGLGIFEVNAEIVSEFSGTIALTAQGGYASYAALMVDANGAPITTWMDLISLDNYNNTRIPATFASVDNTGFTFTNASGQTYGQFTPGTLLVSNPSTGAVYQNTATVSLPPGATGVGIQAQVAGASGTSGPNTVTNLVKTLLGVTCNNGKALVGADAETNAALLDRDKAKLGSLSPNGPAQAYDFVAKSILDPTQRFYNPLVSQPITRTLALSSPARVDLYIANAAGPPSTGDLGYVDAAIQVWAVPLGTTAITHKAGSTTVNVTYTVYVPATSGLTAANIKSIISANLTNYFEGLPIGGVTGASPNIVPWSELLAVIGTSVKQIQATALPTPSGDTAVPPTNVPVIGSVNGTVVFV